jgi:hypothetical protein
MLPAIAKISDRVTQCTCIDFWYVFDTKVRAGTVSPSSGSASG